MPFARVELALDGTVVERDTDLSGLNVEALLKVGEGWLALSDDGKVKRPDPTDDDGDRKCDSIRKKHGDRHAEVYLRARRLP